MSIKKKLLLFLSLSTLVTVTTAVIYRNHFTHWMVERYFAKQNIKITFTVDSFNFSGISLSNILMEDKIQIEELGLRFDSSQFSLGNLNSFSIQMNTFDIEEMKKLIAKLTNSEVESSGYTFSSFQEVCQLIKPLKLDIQIEYFLLKKKVTPLGLRILRNNNEASTKITMEGHLEASPFKEKFSLKKWDYQLDSNVECKKDNIQLSVSSLESKIKSLAMTDQATSLNSLDLNLKDGQVTVSNDNSIKVTLPGDFLIDGARGQTKIHLRSDAITMKALTNLKSLNKGAYELLATKLSIIKPQKVIISKLLVSAKNEAIEFFPLTGNYDISGLSYSNAEDKLLAQGLQMSGRFELEKTIYRSSFNLKDSQGILNFKNSQVLYAPKTQKIKWVLNKKYSSLNLNDLLGSLLPPLEELEAKADGKIHMSGSMGLLGSIFKGHLKLSSKDLNFSSKHAEGKGISFSHSLLGYPSLKSKDHQSFKADEISYGPALKDLNLKYKINDMTDIKVSLFEASIEGAELQAANFSINITDKTMNDFKAFIYKLPLEKALKLALGDSVTASGLLNGDLQIEFDDKKPMAKGKLISKEKGWIRYRKPGSKPPTAEVSSTNPMTILESYLYDFYYDELSIEFTTNEKYEMKMTLRTLGRNPGYLGGKPLKLNINLEQNLLAAFKAMMLTYSLPNKIKDKIEKMGTK